MLNDFERFERGKINFLTVAGVGLMGLSVFIAVGIVANPNIKEIFSPKAALDTNYNLPTTTLPNVPSDLQGFCATGCDKTSIALNDGAQTAGKIGYQYPNGDVAGFYISNGKYYPIAASAGGPTTADIQGLQKLISD